MFLYLQDGYLIVIGIKIDILKNSEVQIRSTLVLHNSVVMNLHRILDRYCYGKIKIIVINFCTLVFIIKFFI